MKARFAEFTLDTDLRQVHGPSGDLHLSPKAFELLVLLVQHRSRVLSKTELQELLWPDTFVVETNLASLVAEIRDILNDDAKNPRFVRTAHRLGYGFCGTLIESPPPATARAESIFCWLLKDHGRIPLCMGDNILGRDAEGAIMIDSPSVSRRHARISVSDTGTTIEDLGSKNGTYVRGERISRVTRLAEGDEVRIGSVALRFRQISASGSTMTVSSPKPI